MWVRFLGNSLFGGLGYPSFLGLVCLVKNKITFVLSWNQVSYKFIYYLPISVDVRKFPETVMYSYWYRSVN
jgi:hypothetical protein